VRRSLCFRVPAGAVTGAVLVTGTSSGLGQAIALDLAARGATVLAGVRTVGTAPSGVGLDGRVHEVQLDVTDPTQIAEAVVSIRRFLGAEHLRGLVNSAGTAVAGPLEYVDVDELRRQFEVNVFGQLAVTQGFLELVREHGSGRVVFVSSVSGRIAAPYVGPYAASKHAVSAMAASLRQELRPWNIHVSVLEPGNVDTPIWTKAAERVRYLQAELPALAIERYGSALERMSRYVDDVAAGRSMTPDQVVRAARHALFAADPKPAYVIGGEARLAVALSRVLPTRTFDLVLDRQMR
jgi:NAD(P)-dependent dehydrogenase (short-subunit alcohol dehydrogenase family)